ncbi:Gfo/Idh/MocA family oxidoreductase [Paenibacillus sp. PL2-23]|uniref:Gfo/Idh/MocA family protein n=1 Tax=Paenibacillus sp. PL2-23 TaxID=2100729 RepID=UPI0030F68197
MRKVSVAIIGLGARGAGAYAPYVKQFPNEVELAAVAEPNPARRELFGEQYNLAKNVMFESGEDFIKQPKLCDAVIICTWDRMHYEFTMKALEKGYHVLLEKPISPDPHEVLHIAQAAKRHQRLLSICHVLRYAKYWESMKKIIDEGKIGNVVSLQLNENVGYLHHAHSFVRGNWSDAEKSSPMILQKSCHDMDLIRWLVGSECTRVSSYGSLSYFNEANAPEGATARCTDGCPHEHTCAFSAPRFYLQDLSLNSFAKHIADPPTLENRLKALEEGQYGRCVFRHDNNVVDHQVVNMEFAGGGTATFSMSAFTRDITRTILIMGTKGEIRGDFVSGVFQYFEFASQQLTEVKVNAPIHHHGGGDEGIMRQFLADVRAERTENLTSADQSVESHMMAFAAEYSRLHGGESIDMREFAASHL